MHSETYSANDSGLNKSNREDITRTWRMIIVGFMLFEHYNACAHRKIELSLLHMWKNNNVSYI